MDWLDWIKSRRSTRKYLGRAVEQEKVEQVVEAGRFAPTGGNMQNTHFLVIRRPEALERLADLARQEFAKMEETPDMYKSLRSAVQRSKEGNYVFTFHAPVLIMTASKKGYPNGMANCACALENMMLMANALDLGSCWVNQLRWLNDNPLLTEALREMGLEADELVYGGMVLGYADTEDGLPVRTPLPHTGNPVTWY